MSQASSSFLAFEPAPAAAPRAYRVLDAASVVDVLAGLPEIRARLGGAQRVWRVRDVADGNLNAVYLVDGPAGGVCVKQALPYVRVAKETWPLDANRARFEAAYSARLAPFETRAADIALFSQNLALQRISVDLIFLDPYTKSARNKIAPALEPWVATLRRDVEIKSAAARLRLAYLTKTQSLLHGDLHSGSIMVTPEETRVIDGEFAWVGPTGFDVGNFIAHLVMAWFAKPFHAEGGKAAAARAAIEQDIVAFWTAFRRRFLEIAAEATPGGDGLPNSHFGDPAGARRRSEIILAYLDDLCRDAIGFLATKVIRRIVGFAQIEDFLVIVDPDKRARAQARALSLACSLLVEPDRYRDIAALVAALPKFDRADLDPGFAP